MRLRTISRKKQSNILSIGNENRRRETLGFYSSKGQYRIVFETMLILVGIFIAGYVITNFGNVEENVTRITVADSFNAVANKVLIGLVKLSANPSGIVRIDVPDAVAEHVYAIALDGEGNAVNVTSLKDPSISVSREIFNIGQVNRVSSSRVVSSARTLELVYEDGSIRLRRGV